MAAVDKYLAWKGPAMQTMTSPTGRQRVRVATDAIVSAYIHEISRQPDDDVRAPAALRARPGPRVRGAEAIAGASARPARVRARGDRPLPFRSGRPAVAPQAA